jgi:hypothetical protein
MQLFPQILDTVAALLEAPRGGQQALNNVLGASLGRSIQLFLIHLELNQEQVILYPTSRDTRYTRNLVYYTQ